MQTKIAIFDFDGTLTNSKAGGNCWRYVWERIGKTEIDDDLYVRFLHGELDGAQWSQLVIGEYRDSGVNQSLVDEITGQIVLREGVKETFEFLKSMGIKIYVLSGGIKQMVTKTLADCLSLIDEIECEELLFDNNGVVNGSKKPIYNTEDKQHFVREIATQNNISPSEIFFMGNGRNDETAHLAGATTLCINPDHTDPNNKNYWDYYLKEIVSFMDILSYIN